MAKVKAGIAIGGLSGTSGGAVFVLRRDGSTLVRERPVPSGSDTPGQRQARRLFSLASAAWRELTDDEQRAWLLWARRDDPLAGAGGAANAFRALAVRWLALDPQGTPPRLPPESPFGGDALELTITGHAGSLRFAADRPNASGVVTELMGISIRSALAEPRDRDFRVLDRFAFSSDELVREVEAVAGRYALGARFVLRSTGQATGVLRLGMVKVD